MADVKLPDIARPETREGSGQGKKPEEVQQLPEIKSPEPKQDPGPKDTEETKLPQVNDQKRDGPEAAAPGKSRKQQGIEKHSVASKDSLIKDSKERETTEGSQKADGGDHLKHTRKTSNRVAHYRNLQTHRSFCFRTKSNLISRLDPYKVEQGEKEMKRITKSIPSNPDSDHGYLYRKTAVDMLDPWDFLELDSVESSRRTVPRYRGSQKRRRDYPNRPPPEGSTYFPKFPNVNYPYGGSESPTRIFELDDVPKVRKQLKKKWSKRSPERVKKDYTKTKNDFYRMELDKLNEMRPTYNRPSMVNTYNAYLKNTPGSKQALDDCISGIQASLLKDQANVSLLPKQPRPSLKKSHSTLTSRTSTRQKVIKVVETPKVEVPRSSLQSRQTIESAG
uniref:Uncharacterized protein n=1 Tax=Magallana gigas TaxID=29159 RepID=K1P6K5_MAGGI